MVIDRAGKDVTITTYTDKTKVDEHRSAVAAQNAEIVKQNAVIDAQVAALRAKLAEKAAQLAQEPDATKKAAIQAEIDKLNAEVAAALASRRAVTVIIGPTTFATESAAESYVDQVKKSMPSAKVIAADGTEVKE